MTYQVYNSRYLYIAWQSSCVRNANGKEKLKPLVQARIELWVKKDTEILPVKRLSVHQKVFCPVQIVERLLLSARGMVIAVFVLDHQQKYSRIWSTVLNLWIGIVELSETFVWGGRILFEIKFTKCNEKYFIKTVPDNVTVLSSSVELVWWNSGDKCNCTH